MAGRSKGDSKKLKKRKEEKLSAEQSLKYKSWVISFDNTVWLAQELPL